MMLIRIPARRQIASDFYVPSYFLWRVFPQPCYLGEDSTQNRRVNYRLLQRTVILAQAYQCRKGLPFPVHSC